ncbi:MAG: hypothetical protein A2287_10365 [Candidatus Melainabacteria bacterium RIFOXYA12_FULL_32_12]|nr:MAG: hypothetical protein A2255_05560 [Candidatus Melainabacteria bacterium RIFOXYA2_FULL_32_9]OGI29184.1 MAG: hypothetical protein A2287_10365 [Candidatus Melainabacteria bacterium RIFOXYA12_FULL_32_12]
MVFSHKTTEYKLDNGLKVLFQNHPCSPSATFMVWYKVGSRNETPGKTGISHFLEHLSFKKTEFFDNGQVVAEITRNGGAFNAFTSRDFTSYYESFATNKLELAMIIESQRMHKLILQEDDREKEVGVILSELEKNLDNPYSVLEVGLREKAYIHHPYKNPIIGWEEDIKSITLDDLNEYYNNFYAPNNATIVVVGNFDQKQTLELIKKHFGSIPPKEINYKITKESPQKSTRRTIIKKPGSSPIVKLAYHIPSAQNKDIFPLIVFSEMLNIGVSGRTYQSLVETQIATDISVSAEVSKDPGLFTIIATLFPGISHKEAEKRILNEINSIIDSRPPTKDEIEKTKRRITSSFEFNRDGTYKLAYLLGYYDTVDTYKFVDNYVDNIQKVTIDEIKDAVKNYLDISNATIADFIPSHAEPKKFVATYDYTPHETIHHIYKTPPILIEDKITAAPISFSKKTLNNGMKVLFTENKTSNTVKLYGTIYAGNMFSSLVNPALPSVCGGMLNRGSKGKSKFEIADEVESRGASVGISNIGEAVNFSLSSTTNDFPFILDILAKILMEPSFPEDEFDKYKHLSIAGMRQKKYIPAYLARLAFSQMVYPRHHVLYSYAFSTQEKQIKQITLDDVRSFYETFYSSNTVILGIAGNFKAEEVFKLVEERFGHWEPKKMPEPQIKRISLQKKYKEKAIFVEGKTEAEVIFGHFGNLARKDPDFHKATVMNFILGGSGALSSRIGKRIREDLGLVYSISSGFNALMIPGSWSVRFGVDTHYADITIQALKEELVRFIEEGITDSELDLAKSCLIGSYPLRFANNSGIAKSLLINEFYELGDNYLNEYPSIIGEITKEDVNQAAKKYIHPEVASVVKAGNFK